MEDRLNRHPKQICHRIALHHHETRAILLLATHRTPSQDSYHSVHPSSATGQPSNKSPINPVQQAEEHKLTLTQSPNVQTCLHSPGHLHVRAAAAGERDTSDMPESMLWSRNPTEKARPSGLQHISRVQESASDKSSAGSPFCSPLRSTGIQKQTHSVRSHSGPKGSHEASNKRCTQTFLLRC